MLSKYTVRDVSHLAHIRMKEKCYEVHDSETGYTAKVTLYPGGVQTEDRAIEIARGHFAAKARKEAKAL